MRRSTRPRRLSIAAKLSLLAFVALSALGARSFWTADSWTHGDRRAIGFALGRGQLACAYVSMPPEMKISGHHQSTDAQSFETPSAILPFNVVNRVFHFPSGDLKQHALWVSLWFPLLLLLIAPARWLIARPANARAFPVVTDAKRE